MLNIKNYNQSIKLNLIKRNFIFNHKIFFTFDLKIRQIKTKLYNFQYKYNFLSILIKNLKTSQLNFSYVLNEVTTIKTKIHNLNEKLKYLEKKLKNFLLLIPNILHKSVVYGQTPLDNIEIRIFQKIIKKNYEIIKDIELNNKFIDFDLSSKISGNGFVILKNDIALLHRALGNYMLDLHVYKHKYCEIYSPVIVNENSMLNTGHFPKFYSDQFNLTDSNLWLIPTAEVVLSNIVNNKILEKKNMPIKLVSKTLCFRKEKGNYGKKVKGLIRQHQFEKVELVQITSPNTSYYYLEELTNHAETVLQNLNLPYRIIALCSNDTGFTSSKTYDLEVWFPKRKRYIEVSSCSNTESFQSYRMNTKIKNTQTPPHILNGSGLAIGRVLLGLIENYSDNNGNITIPDVLKKYMNGKSIITFF